MQAEEGKYGEYDDHESDQINDTVHGIPPLVLECWPTATMHTGIVEGKAIHVPDGRAIPEPTDSAVSVVFPM